MFFQKSKYYYGDGTDHILELKPSYVKSFLRFEQILGGYHWKQLASGVAVNVRRKDIKRHKAVADILNAYLKNHTVYYNDLEQPLLRPVD